MDDGGLTVSAKNGYVKDQLTSRLSFLNVRYLTFAYIFFDLSHVPFLCPLACVFISWLTAHSLINYFTLKARVSGVRICNF